MSVGGGRGRFSPPTRSDACLAAPIPERNARQARLSGVLDVGVPRRWTIRQGYRTTLEMDLERAFERVQRMELSMPPE